MATTSAFGVESAAFTNVVHRHNPRRTAVIVKRVAL